MQQLRRYVLLLIVACACSKNKTEQENSADARTVRATGDQRAPKPPIIGDAEINAAVEYTLRRDPGIAPAAIQVKTTDGIVELTGNVDDLLTKRRAVRVAEAVKGVRAVSERLQLNVPHRPDSELTKHVQDALLLDTAIQASKVKVEADDGSVTLTGSVRSYQQRDLSQWRAESIAGVREVDNQLRIEHGVARSDAEIASDVESRLHWDALVNDGLVEVNVREGVVTLTGQVASAAERRRAAADAWVFGTKRVNDSDLAVNWQAKERDLTKDKLLGKADPEIAEAIRAAAAYDPRLSAADLKISVDGGAVTLRGSVGTYSGKFAAEDLAHNTVGVTKVENQLAVRPSGAVADSTVQRAVQSALLWNPYTNAFDIDITVKSGVVTLTGEVDTAFSRATATDVSSSIDGVRDIDNNIKVKRKDLAYAYVPYHQPYGPYWGRSYDGPRSTTRSDALIAQDIRNELKWSPFVDLDDVEVRVEGGRAMLSGQVSAASEAQAATRNAYEGGAIEVENRLRIAPTERGR
jgi:osmotically-inducible protein OsmY